MTTSQRHEELEVPDWTFGDRIRKVRRMRGLTQADFARQLGVGEKAAAAWEVFDRQPRDIVAIARRVEQVFGVPAAWMLGLDDVGPRPTGPGTNVSTLLPRLDSNQQPSGYLSMQVTSLDERRRRPERVAA